ncbi:radical SAM protein [Micromonospora carbonacea]|uniref:radical SAM protein n=1 Tax=Micromonospora carbonacea TaxID=47853 RepID=UPI003D70E8FB
MGHVGERLLRGRDTWWLLGPGGVARVGHRQVTDTGELRPSAHRLLDERGLFRSTPERVYSLTVLTSTDCNLGCGYCFQNTGQDSSGGSRPPRIKRARLTSATITSILGFADRQMARAGLHKLGVLLFGGEPLLNPRGCVELLSRAADHNLVSAWMISNATLLTPPLARELTALGLRSVQVTFDGDRDDHDRIRVRRSPGGTFDTIVRNIVQVTAATELRWMLRVNVSHHNYQGIDALLERLAGSVDPQRCSIYFARVGDVGVGYANELLHSGELEARFTRWHRTALEHGFTVPRPRADLPCVTCESGEGRHGAVVNADGALASCWETAGQPGWEVGTVDEGYLPVDRRAKRWISCGDMYRHHESAQALADFRDAVDAALLDDLHEKGLL